MKLKTLIYCSLAMILAIVEAQKDVVATEKPIIEPSGVYVSLSDHRLYINCMGEGKPVIIFESGIGGSSLEWIDLQRKLAQHTKNCAYDRGGYGWSDPGPGPRDVKQLSNELHMVLERQGISGPFIFVGHSFGGLISLYNAAVYPNETAGLVLVDSSHPRQEEKIPALLGKGTVAAINPVTVEDQTLGLSDEYLQGAFLNRQRKAVFAQMNEIKSFKDSSRQADQLQKIQDIPMAVLTRSYSRKSNPELERNWLLLQESLAKISSDAQHIIIADSDHNIHLRQPDEVVKIIKAMINRVRNQGVER